MKKVTETVTKQKPVAIVVVIRAVYLNLYLEQFFLNFLYPIEINLLISRLGTFVSVFRNRNSKSIWINGKSKSYSQI